MCITVSSINSDNLKVPIIFLKIVPQQISLYNNGLKAFWCTIELLKNPLFLKPYKTE